MIGVEVRRRHDRRISDRRIQDVGRYRGLEKIEIEVMARRCRVPCAERCMLPEVSVITTVCDPAATEGTTRRRVTIGPLGAEFAQSSQA